MILELTFMGTTGSKSRRFEVAQPDQFGLVSFELESIRPYAAQSVICARRDAGGKVFYMTG
jgi:hypothetical protein